MDTIQVTARLTIYEGKLEEFKELAAQCMRSVREPDSGSQDLLAVPEHLMADCENSE